MAGSSDLLPTLSGGHPELVKAAIRMKGETLTSLALNNELCEAYLRNTLRRPLQRGEEIIAKFLGLAPKEIWPDRYDAHGKPDYAKWRRQRDAERRKRIAAKARQ